MRQKKKKISGKKNFVSVTLSTGSTQTHYNFSKIVKKHVINRLLFSWIFYSLGFQVQFMYSSPISITFFVISHDQIFVLIFSMIFCGLEISPLNTLSFSAFQIFRILQVHNDADFLALLSEFKKLSCWKKLRMRSIWGTINRLSKHSINSRFL